MGAVAFATLLAWSPAPARASDFPPLGIPGVRLTGGARFQLAPGGSTEGALDVLLDVQLLWPDSGLYLTPMFGYGYDGGGAGSDLFQLGLDAGVATSTALGISVGVRGLLGDVEGALGGGLRVVTGLDLWFGVFRVEGAYQLLSVAGPTRHDVRAMVGVDLLRLLATRYLMAVDEL